jgi:phage-related protein (TIGR01555 family)
MDGWNNVLTGMGQAGRDRKESTTFASEFRLGEIFCRNLYTFSGIAKTIIDLPVYDGLRKWFTIEGDEDNQIMDELKRIKGGLGNSSAKKELSRAWKFARQYGGSLLILYANDGRKMDEPLDENNIRDIERVVAQHRWRTSRMSYYLDAGNPRYGETEMYNVTTVQPFPTNFMIHESRCIAFDGVDCSPEIRQGNFWWGDSVYQAIYQRLRGLGESFSNIEHIIGEFVLMVTKIKGLTDKLAEGREDELIDRAVLNNLTRHVMNSYMIDADGEDAQRISTTTTGLRELVEIMMMSVSAETRIPIRRLFGSPIQAAGLGKEGDEETNDYYDYVIAERADAAEPQLERFIKLLMLQKEGPFGGKELDNWKINWPPIREDSQTVKLDNQKKQIEIDRQNWEMGVYDENEIRQKGYENSMSHDRVMEKRAPIETTLERTRANEDLPLDQKDKEI